MSRVAVGQNKAGTPLCQRGVVKLEGHPFCGKMGVTKKGSHPPPWRQKQGVAKQRGPACVQMDVLQNLGELLLVSKGGGHEIWGTLPLCQQNGEIR